MLGMKAPTTLELIWEHDLVFNGRSGESSMVLDSAGKAGPSPVQALAFALAGCMGMDVVHMLQEGAARPARAEDLARRPSARRRIRTALPPSRLISR